MDGSFVVAFLGAATMASFALGLWLPAYLRYRTIQRRLAGFLYTGGPGGLAIDLGGRRRTRVARRPYTRLRRQVVVRYIARQIGQAQVDFTPGEVATAMGVLASIALVVVLVVTRSTFLALVAAPVGAWIPVLWLRRRAARRQLLFSEQLPDTVALLASSVRAGHSLLQALEHVAAQAAEPTSSAFGVVVREIGLGAAQEDALERLADRFPSEDLTLIVTAVNVHHQIGGSLAKVLDVISETIRERIRLAGDIRGLTAQQRYSAYVLSLLPVAVTGLLMTISPDYMSVMFESPLLQQALTFAGVLLVTGFLVMRRLATIDV